MSLLGRKKGLIPRSYHEKGPVVEFQLALLGLENEPGWAALAGGVGAGGILGDEVGVALGLGGLAGGIEGFWGSGAVDGAELKTWGEDEGFEAAAAVLKGEVEEGLAVEPEEVEDEEALGRGVGEEEVGVSAGGFWGVGGGEELAVEDDVAVEGAGALEECRKTEVEGAEGGGEEGGAGGGAVELGAGAFGFGFEPECGVGWGEKGFSEGGGGGGGEHGGQGAEGVQGGGGGGAGLGALGGFADVAREEVGGAEFEWGAVEGGGEGVFEEALFEGGGGVAGEDVEGVAGAAGGEVEEGVGEEFRLGGRA